MQISSFDRGSSVPRVLTALHHSGRGPITSEILERLLQLGSSVMKLIETHAKRFQSVSGLPHNSTLYWEDFLYKLEVQRLDLRKMLEERPAIYNTRNHGMWSVFTLQNQINTIIKIISLCEAMKSPGFQWAGGKVPYFEVERFARASSTDSQGINPYYVNARCFIEVCINLLKKDEMQWPLPDWWEIADMTPLLSNPATVRVQRSANEQFHLLCAQHPLSQKKTKWTLSKGIPSISEEMIRVASQRDPASIPSSARLSSRVQECVENMMCLIENYAWNLRITFENASSGMMLWEGFIVELRQQKKLLQTSVFQARPDLFKSPKGDKSKRDMRPEVVLLRDQCDVLVKIISICEAMRWGHGFEWRGKNGLAPGLEREDIPNEQEDADAHYPLAYRNGRFFIESCLEALQEVEIVRPFPFWWYAKEENNEQKVSHPQSHCGTVVRQCIGVSCLGENIPERIPKFKLGHRIFIILENRNFFGEREYEKETKMS